MQYTIIRLELFDLKLTSEIDYNWLCVYINLNCLISKVIVEIENIVQLYEQSASLLSGFYNLDFVERDFCRIYENKTIGFLKLKIRIN
jgi:hypothetical protein